VIPRYQRILFWSLAAAILIMGLVLLRGCHQTREKLTRPRDETPLSAPLTVSNTTVQLAMANDADGSILMAQREVALPDEPSARARALLARLITEYAYKNSAHPLESGPAIDDVFLLDLPLRQGGGSPVSTLGANTVGSTGGQLAVINLHGAFADHHPSGIEAESLTIQSIIGTVYANFPRIQQVRFLVDGHPRETLNGHADLLRTYTVANTATSHDQGPR
jgi:hypothetical protein